MFIPDGTFIYKDKNIFLHTKVTFKDTFLIEKSNNVL